MVIYWHYKRIKQEREAAYQRIPLPEEIYNVDLPLAVTNLIANSDVTKLR